MYDQDNGENQIKSNKINLFVLGGVFYIFYFGGRGGRGGAEPERRPLPARRTRCNERKEERKKGRILFLRERFQIRRFWLPDSTIMINCIAPA